jgi:hypothetical protein
VCLQLDTEAVIANTGYSLGATDAVDSASYAAKTSAAIDHARDIQLRMMLGVAEDLLQYTSLMESSDDVVRRCAWQRACAPVCVCVMPVWHVLPRRASALSGITTSEWCPPAGVDQCDACWSCRKLSRLSTAAWARPTALDALLSRTASCREDFSTASWSSTTSRWT